jgi:thiamine pyrophosphokinase
MRRAIIVCNGNLSHPTYSHLPTDYVIAVDGGADLLRTLRLKPDVIIGDMDSISLESRQIFADIKHIPYPKEKDFTDTELAITYAIDQRCTEIHIIGFLGNRLDHMMANFFFFMTLIEKNIDLLIIEGNQRLSFINKVSTIHGSKGDLLSLIPFGHTCEGISTEGLQYPLTDEILPVGSTRGVSNVFLLPDVTIGIKQGTLLAVHTLSSPAEEIHHKSNN